MKKLILILLISVALTGCTTSTISQYESENTGEEVADCSSLEPYNPYSSGTGHYAGYEWAEKKDVLSCGGNSQSFIEGCEEYLSQSIDYEDCLNK